MTAGACRGRQGGGGEPHQVSLCRVGRPGGQDQHGGPGQQHLLPHRGEELREDLSPFELARPGIPAKRLGSTREVSSGGEVGPCWPACWVSLLSPVLGCSCSAL